MEILGYAAALFIGVSLGMVGSGGSILAVPVLVYLFGMHPLQATTSSLFIVGVTSLLGGILAYKKKQTDIRSVAAFGISSIFSVYMTRLHILPAIPATLFKSGNITVEKGTFLMLLFAGLMLAASLLMILGPRQRIEQSPAAKYDHSRTFPLLLLGLGVGLVTGLLGAGGGFLIIPALLLFLKLPIRTAIGTSLLIVAMNSLFGFLISTSQFDFNWSVLTGFTLLSVTGMFIGRKLAEKIHGDTLKKGFGWFVLAMGLYILTKELFLH